jgi:hypothetical protein
MTTTAEQSAVATLAVFISDSSTRLIGFPTKRDARNALAALRSLERERDDWKRQAQSWLGLKESNAYYRAKVEQLEQALRRALDRFDQADRGTFDDRVTGLAWAMASDLRAALDQEEARS